ncbi:LamG-like jellyroll fold domain-containing protein [Nonomuraea sp. NPDC050783]|uniref:LamG-like jellyroll fold domain-containing protein n=1 Tax=Nonomuraea sp. NPDC050783 TaxID=3154634 RepID=UPI0034675F74
MTEQEALERARKSGEPVEVPSQRGEHRTVRALPSGQLEATEYLRPVRTRRDGRWVDIDTGLRASGSEVLPGATTVGLRLSNGGDGPLTRMSRGGRELTLSWPQPLPQPVLEHDTAVYQGVLGPDVDLRVRAEPDGFAHTLVVRTAEAAKDPRLAGLTFRLDAPQLSITTSPGGGLRADDAATGTGVFEAPAPLMWDSTGSARARGAAPTPDPSAAPGEGARIAPVGAQVSGGRLTLTPDQSLLTSPDTTFPVYIDPVWQTNAAYAWAMVSSGYPKQTYYKFAGNATEGMGRCLVQKDPDCGIDQTKRLFFRMKLPSVKGSYIQSAEFVAFETHAYDCHNSTAVELWRISSLTSGATWNNTSGAWTARLAYRDVAYCSRAPVEFGGATLRSHVQDAVNKGYTTITFGLKAYQETTMAWWKRFADDAYLRVQYNRPPTQPDTGAMFAGPGTPCLDAPQAKAVNVRSKLYAVLRDPDTEDAAKVQAQFQLHWADKTDGSDWGAKWTAPLTPAKTSGSRFEVDLEALNVQLPVRKLLAWGVRAWDGEQWGPWSWDGAQTGCYFTYDPAVPAAPTVSSADYPDDGTWRGGIGEAGAFILSDAEGVAARYDLSLNGTPLTSVTTTAGQARQVRVVPDRSGPNLLTVQAFTQAGQNSSPTTYEFWVRAGADPVARFTLDDAAGATTATAQAPGTAAILRGGAALGGAGRAGTALELDGTTGYAETNLPVIDTSRSFSVSAWVRLDAQDPARYYTVLSQAGVHKSAFFLRYDVGSGKWVFARPYSDSTVQDDGWATAWSAGPAVFGRWTHMVGVYDQDTQKMRVYLDGVPGTDSRAATSVWRAGGGLQIGLAKWLGRPTDYLPGAIDDVRVFQRALSPADAQALAGNADPSGDAPAAHWTLDEEQGARRAYSPAAPLTAALRGGATLGAEGQDGGALRLNGVNGVAATGGPVIDTSRSFSVAAWVWVDSLASGRHLSVLSQDGVNRSGFYLKYDPVQRKWVFTRFAEDSPASDGLSFPSWSKEPARAGAWTHLAGVWDADAQRMRLYVNGEAMAPSAVVTSAWSATGALQIGRSQWQGAPADHFPGVIDDVRVYDRVLGAGEIEELVTQHPELVARWAFNTDGSAEPAGALAMSMNGGATIDPNAGFRSISAAGLALNGTSAYAQTAASPVRTDDSFTIAGWVYNLGRPATARTVFSQPGVNTNAFALRYVPDTAEPEEAGAWRLEMNNADDAASPPRTALHPSLNEQDWDHVAIVYDALRDRMSLYVNGALHQSEAGVSQQKDVLGIPASGGLQVGRSRFGAATGGEFWPGAIDDVWIYQGALTAEQIGYLAGGGELPTEDGP